MKGCVLGVVSGLGLCTVLALACGYLTINIGASLPGWLYRCRALTPAESLQRGMTIRYRPPAAVQALIHQMAPQAVLSAPWLKQVGAAAGDEVCWSAAVVDINRQPMLRLPLLGEFPLGVQAHCTVLGPDEVLPLGTAARSFDGRYTGTLRRAEILSVCAQLL